jgi:ATP-binding cassette subfamily C protein LapB
MISSHGNSARSLKPTFDWFWRNIASEWREYANIGVAAVFINVLSLSSSLFVMNVYDRVVPNQATETLWALTFGIAIAFSFDFALRLVRGYLVDYAGARADTRLSSLIYRTALDMKLAAKPRSAGGFVSQIKEFDSLRDFLTSATLMSLIDLPFALVFIVVMVWIGGSVAWAPVLAFPVVLVIGAAMQIPMMKLQRATQETNIHKYGTLVESFEGLETIKANTAEAQLHSRYDVSVRDSAELGLKTRLYSSVALNLSTFVQQIVSVAIVILGYYEIVAGRLTTGGLIACTILGGRALGALAQVAGLMARYQQARLALQTLDGVMSLPPEREPGKTYLKSSLIRGDIEFSTVSFAYPGQQLPVLDKVSFRIKSGEKVAILGRIGSGKSTLLKLSGGFHEPATGHIAIDGLDIAQFDPADLRQSLGYLSQDTTLFLGTLRDNLRLGRPGLSDDEMLESLRIAEMGRYVARHPAGLDLPIGERGEGLSGGQRQAVACARMLLRNPRIVMMDEPSSAMDHATEVSFINNLRGWMGSRTLLLVTHKPSMLALVERIILVDSGRIVADGAKETVMAALNKGQISVPNP